MNVVGKLGRRSLVKLGLLSAGIPAFSNVLGASSLSSLSQVRGRADEELGYPANNLPGGAQLEIRLTVSPYTDDPDEIEAYQRIKPYNPQSWFVEWKRIAEANERMAEKFEAEKRRVTAHQFYLRAAETYRWACVRQNDDEPTTIPTYKKFRQLFDKAWQLVPPPFERVQIPHEGNLLDGYFIKPAKPANHRFPVVIEYQGADTSAESDIVGGHPRGASWAAPYVARGMAYLAVNTPGSLGALCMKGIHAKPEYENVAKDLVDYLVSRPDVDPDHIGMLGISLGSYSAPRCASGEKRIKAVWVMSGTFNLLEDIFDYYPPIRDRLRWIVGGQDLSDARKKIAAFTLEGRAQLIECPMLIGYSSDDRIMDPRGALKLYRAAVKSKREMIDGQGHGFVNSLGGPRAPINPILQDWAAMQLGAELAGDFSLNSGTTTPRD